MSQEDSKFKEIVRRAMAFYLYSKNISTECPIFPDHVHIEPTNMCNLRCIHCHHSKRGTSFTKKMGIMDLDLFKKVIDEIKTVSSRITLNQQGEPTLHPNILEMIAYAKNAGLSVSLLTNGSKLSEEMSETLIKLGLNRIVFSFEGSHKEIHEKVRKNSQFDSTLKNILYFIKRNHETDHKVYICMSMVESSYTRDDVESYKAYFNALPIDTIFVNPMLTMSGGTLLSHEVDMEPFQHIEKEDVPVCRLPWETIVVNWDGTVSACPVDYNESHIVGDVNAELLQDVWNSDGMQKFRQCHIDKDYTWIEEQGPLCLSCNFRFDKENDLRDMDDYMINYIERQARIYAGDLTAPDIESDDAGMDVKVKTVQKELERMTKRLDE